MDLYGMTPPPERLDLHNSEVDELTARSNLCGYQDLRTGRVCKLPARHTGSCRFVPKPLPGEEPPAEPAEEYWASWPVLAVEERPIEEYPGPGHLVAGWRR